MPAPPEYGRFTQRRAMWRELGMTPETSTHTDWVEAVTFLTIEAKYPEKSGNGAK